MSIGSVYFTQLFMKGVFLRSMGNKPVSTSSPHPRQLSYNSCVCLTLCIIVTLGPEMSWVNNYSKWTGCRKEVYFIEKLLKICRKGVLSIPDTNSPVFCYSVPAQSENSLSTCTSCAIPASCSLHHDYKYRAQKHVAMEAEKKGGENWNTLIL